MAKVDSGTTSLSSKEQELLLAVMPASVASQALSFRRQKTFILFLFLILCLIFMQSKNEQNCLNSIQQTIYYQNKDPTPAIAVEEEEEEDKSRSTQQQEVKKNNFFESNIRPKLVKKLCPNTKPNSPIGVQLFTIAQKELGLKTTFRSRTIDDYNKTGSSASIFQFHGNNATPFVFVGIWKAAHNQIRDWLREQLKDKPFGAYKDYDTAFKVKETLRSKGTRKACIVTAIRDPISHFLSGYNEMECQYVENPSRMPSPHPSLYTRFQNGTKNRFTQFVMDYITGRWELGMKGMLLFGHVFSMSGILNHIPHLTSYLPTVHNLTTNWPRFMVDTCSESVPKELANKTMIISGQRDSQNDPFGYYSAAKEVWKDQGQIARALCIIHAIDYACWDRLPDGIPQLCKDVYSSNEEFISLL